MEQVFLLVNKILSESRVDRKDEVKLFLRTYRVIPIQPLVGVLEWVKDSTPIGDYLVNAHERIHPNDITPRDARIAMKTEFERAGSNAQSKHAVYKNEVCARFNPVFKFFFLENSATCQEWLSKRANYISSTAVSSIVGYMVGLGDRHCQNIMIDSNTGDLIQIDLNMIFELGRLLRIPERVPFRLTRDMVSGMGVAGLEAGFKPAAETTLTVLRSKMDMMLMIMEAFRYDPLYRWSQLPMKIGSSAMAMTNVGLHPSVPQTAATLLADDDFEEGHKEADRALLRVREKLLGIEEGTTLSEKGQVSYLIQVATNEELLAQMYPGWQPWM